jgi:hypothetical protein
MHLLWANESDGTIWRVDDVVYYQDYVFLVFLLYFELYGSSALSRKASYYSFQCCVLYWCWLIYEIFNVWSDTARCAGVEYCV